LNLEKKIRGLSRLSGNPEITALIETPISQLQGVTISYHTVLPATQHK